MTRLLIYISFTIILLSAILVQAQTLNHMKYDVFIPVGRLNIVAKKDSNNQLKYGLIDIENKVLVPLEYDQIVDDFKGTQLFWTRKGNKWGGIRSDENGNIDIITPRYDEKPATYWGMIIIAVQGGKYGLIDDYGKEITPFKYDRMSLSRFDNIITVEESEEKYFINKKGVKVKESFSYSIAETIYFLGQSSHKVIKITVTANHWSFHEGAHGFRMRVTDGINTKNDFDSRISPDREKLIAFFAFNAFENFTTNSKIEICYGGEVSGSIEDVNVHDVIALPDGLKTYPYKIGDNAWLDSIIDKRTGTIKNRFYIKKHE